MNDRLSIPAQLRRGLGLGLSCLGLVAGAGPGCIFPDYCISVGVTGTEVCQQFHKAAGTNEEGELVSPIFDGVGVVKGCICLYDAEVEVLDEGDPESVVFQDLMFQLEVAARQRCLKVASEQGLSDINCLEAEVDGFLIDDPGACVAGCVYSNPPPGERCPETCIWHEIGDGETGGASTGAETGGDSAGEETGSDSSGEETGGPPASPGPRWQEAAP